MPQEGLEMNKVEILKEIEKTKQHLTNMEKMLEDKEWEEKAQRWKPKSNERYWYVTSTNHTAQTDFVMGDDFQRWLIYNCFKTEKEANQETEKLLIRRQLEAIAQRLNKGRKIDWASTTQRKYLIYFNHCCDRIELDNSRVHQIQGVIYCLDEKFLDVAVKEIGETRLMRYLKGCWING